MLRLETQAELSANLPLFPDERANLMEVTLTIDDADDLAALDKARIACNAMRADADEAEIETTEDYIRFVAAQAVASYRGQHGGP